ncbi:MAG: hypothetical protein J6Y08_09710 [Clostridiales bacterium]|nr:hypothetical protein [Clostridiales bacterium]
MAQKKASNSRSSRSNSRSGSGKKPSVNARSSSKKVQPVYEDTESIFSKIWSYSWGKVLYAVVALLLIIALDFLISMNHYDRFFMVLGIEIIAGMIIGWIVFLLIERSKQIKQLNESEDQEV